MAGPVARASPRAGSALINRGWASERTSLPGKARAPVGRPSPRGWPLDVMCCFIRDVMKIKMVMRYPFCLKPRMKLDHSLSVIPAKAGIQNR